MTRFLIKDLNEVYAKFEWEYSGEFGVNCVISKEGIVGIKISRESTC